MCGLNEVKGMDVNMKVVKIGAIWCSGCLVMNKVWKKVNEKFLFDIIELDYDMDEEEVFKYNPGNILPVFIFFEKDKELFRIVGEIKESEFIKKIEDYYKKD